MSCKRSLSSKSVMYRVYMHYVYASPGEGASPRASVCSSRCISPRECLSERELSEEPLFEKVSCTECTSTMSINPPEGCIVFERACARHAASLQESACASASCKRSLSSRKCHVPSVQALCQYIPQKGVSSSSERVLVTMHLPKRVHERA